MQLEDAIEFIKPAFTDQSKSALWADLGCGTGLFTTAVSSFLKEESVIYAVDANANALNKIKVNARVTLQKIIADFENDELPLSNLDGILMANSFHYISNKKAFLNKSRKWLKENALFLLVEYDTDKANHWVPYPLSFQSATTLFKKPFYKSIKKIGERSSLYNRAGMYAALIEL